MSWGNLGGRPGRPLPADSAIPITIALIYGSACLTVAALSSLLGGGVLQVSPLPDSATVCLALGLERVILSVAALGSVCHQ